MAWAMLRSAAVLQCCSAAVLFAVNTGNVSKLVPVWTQSMGSVLGQQAMAVLHDGVLYISLHGATVAMEALSSMSIVFLKPCKA
jgi:hypothetical protein